MGGYQSTDNSQQTVSAQAAINLSGLEAQINNFSIAIIAIAIAIAIIILNFLYKRCNYGLNKILVRRLRSLASTAREPPQVSGTPKIIIS